LDLIVYVIGQSLPNEAFRHLRAIIHHSPHFPLLWRCIAECRVLYFRQRMTHRA
jgi:hypothetical protein